MNDEDDMFFYQNVEEKLKNFGMGIYYHTDRFYSGLSFSQYFGDGIIINDTDTIETGFTNLSIINGFAGYVFDLSEKIKLKPSIMAFHNSINQKSWFYFTGNVYLLDSFNFGVHYNFSRAVAFSINSPTIAKTFKLGLAIDFLEKNDFFDTSYQNFMVFTNFNIDVFGNENTQKYF